MGGGGGIPYPSLLCSRVLSLISPHRLKKYTERQIIFTVETSKGARNTGVNTLAKNFPFSDLYHVCIVLQSTHSKSIEEQKRKLLRRPTTTQYLELTQKSFPETSSKKYLRFFEMVKLKGGQTLAEVVWK